MPNRKIIIGIQLILALFLINVNVAVNANNLLGIPTKLESFDLPEYGRLKILVPEVWNYRYTITDEFTPPILTFFMRDKNNVEIFQLNISILREESFLRNITSKYFIHSLVYETGKKLLVLSKQSELALHEITGTSGKGYFFDLSDKNPKKGEYKFLNQGALAINKLLLIFSLFNNDGEKSTIRNLMLEVIASAQHHNRKDL